MNEIGLHSVVEILCFTKQNNFVKYLFRELKDVAYSESKEVYWSIIRTYGTAGSMIPCIHVLFQSFFTAIFSI